MKFFISSLFLFVSVFSFVQKKGEESKALNQHFSMAMRSISLFLLTFFPLCSFSQQIGDGEIHEDGLVAKFIENRQFDSVIHCSQKFIDDYQYVLSKQKNTRSANRFYALGISYFYKSRLDSALFWHENALNLRESVLGINHPETVESYLAVGKVKYMMTDYDAAIDAFQKALSVQLKLLDEDNPSVAKIYNLIGSAYREKGSLEQAIKCHHKALGILNKVDHHPNDELGVTHEKLGNILFDQSNLDEALEMYREALYIYQGVNGKRGLSRLIKIYDKMGRVYDEKRLYNLALEYYFQAFNLAKETGGINKFTMAYLNNSIAITYRKKKMYTTALQYYHDAKSMFLDIFPEDNINVANIDGNIGGLHSDMGKYDSALVYQKKALNVHRKFYGADHYMTSIGYINIGLSYARKKNYEAALSYYLKALEVSEKNDRGNRYDIGLIHQHIAELYLDKLALQDALKSIEQVIQHYFSNETLSYLENPDLTTGKFDRKILNAFSTKSRILSLLYQKTKNNSFYEAATESYAKCDTLIAQISKTLMKRDDYVSYGQVFVPIYKGAASHLMLSHDPDFRSEAFRYSEKSKASFLLSSIIGEDALKVANIPDSILLEERNLKRSLADLTDQGSTEAGVSIGTSGGMKAFSLYRRYEQFISQLEKDYPAYHRLKYADHTVSLKEIQDILDDDEVMLSYSLGSDSSVLFCITQEHAQLITIPHKDELQATIDRYYNVLQNESPIDVFVPEAIRLYQMLLAPAKSFIADKQRLIIIHPSLLSVPFEAMLTSEPDDKTLKEGDYGQLTYLMDQFSISYHYSASLWYLGKNAMRKNKVNHSLLALAPFSEGEGQVLNTRSGNHPLPESKVEVNRLYELFRSKALEASVSFSHASDQAFLMKGARQASILHIATHSETDYRDQNLARIHLAECLEQPEYHKETCLYPSDIYLMDLMADLVVLSSCDSGAGKAWQSEGVMSLGRAFLNAGAHHVISSLWEADDVFSKDFMLSFYQNLLSGKPYKQSLRNTKLAMSKSSEWYHPKYWSNFILMGN